MNVKELGDLLATIQVGQQNIPVAYDHFEEKVGGKVVPPFILFRVLDTTTIKADDKVHYQENNYVVDLVAESKILSIPLETQLETLFNDNYLPYDKEETYLSSERIYQIRYFI